MKDGGGYCFSHNPRTQEALHEAAIKGGSMLKKNTLDLPPVGVKTIQDVVLLIEDTVNRVRSGEMPINTANCLGYLGNVALKALQASDLEKRIEALEAIIGERKKIKTIAYE